MEKINFQDLPSTSTPLSSTNLNQMQDNMEDAIIPIKLVNIGIANPSTATTGDMFYNTIDNKVYTAIGENTWDSGSTPRYDGFYINTSDNTLFYYNGSTLIGVGGSGSGIGGDTLPVGMIMPGAMTGDVSGWLICRGQAVSRTEYSELFNAIGTTYGSGDGSTTFNIPDIASRMIIGYDSGDDDFDSLGATGGSKTHTQTINEMPSHSHPSPNGGKFVEDGGSGTNITTARGVDFATKTTVARTGVTGNGQAMNIMNPYIVMNYYIKAHQTAPVTATVKNEETTSETDVYSCNYVNNIKQNTDRIILWENPNPDIAFSTQTVSLASSDYNYYEVIWGIDTNAQHLLSSGKIPAGFGTQLFRISANSGDPLRVRTVNAGATLGELVFNNAYSGASATTTIDNSQTIPKVIYGYYN